MNGSVLNRSVALEPDVFHLCQRCNACCRWPGDVRIDEAEVTRIAAFLGLTEQEFIARHTRLRSDRQGLSLLERENHECVMLEDGGCRIHAVKPDQCAGFPNRWRFPGWREVCESVPVPIAEARRRGLVDDPGAGSAEHGLEPAPGPVRRRQVRSAEA